MSGGGNTRFAKGQSGNPAGRPKARRPNISAFDIIFDKTLTVTQGGVERELTIDEALQFQTLQGALKGSKMAVRAVLKMIEKREAALAKRNPAPVSPFTVEHHYSSDNAEEAMRILDIADYDPKWGGAEGQDRRLRITTWAAQAGLSRPGRGKITEHEANNIRFFTLDADQLKWPRGKVS